MTPRNLSFENASTLTRIAETPAQFDDIRQSMVELLDEEWAIEIGKALVTPPERRDAVSPDAAEAAAAIEALL